MASPSPSQPPKGAAAVRVSAVRLRRRSIFRKSPSSEPPKATADVSDLLDEINTVPAPVYRGRRKHKQNRAVYAEHPFFSSTKDAELRFVSLSPFKNSSSEMVDAVAEVRVLKTKGDDYRVAALTIYGTEITAVSECTKIEVVDCLAGFSRRYPSDFVVLSDDGHPDLTPELERIHLEEISDVELPDLTTDDSSGVAANATTERNEARIPRSLSMEDIVQFLLSPLDD